MTTYYCHTCALQIHANPDISNYNLTGSADGYQLGKFIKHTIATPLLGVTSSYYDKTYESYKDYTVNSVASGSLEVVTRGNNTEYNYIFYAGKNIGCQFVNGQPTLNEDAVKVVLSNNPNKIHSYTTGSFGIKQANCSKCGLPIVR